MGPADEIELHRPLVARKVLVSLTQPKDLLSRQPVQISQDGDCLLPVVAHPRERQQDQPLVLAAKVMQQTTTGPARALGVSGQFRPVASDGSGVVRSERSPQLGQAGPIPHLSVAESLAAVQFPLQPKPQAQQFFVGHVEPIAPAAGNRLKEEVFAKAAVLRAAEADAPRDAAAGVTSQPKGAVLRPNQVVVEDDKREILDFDEAALDRTIGEIAQGGQRAWLRTIATSAAKPFAPQLDWRGLQGCDHGYVSGEDGERE